MKCSILDDDIFDDLGNDTIDDILDEQTKRELYSHHCEPIYIKNGECSWHGDAEDEIGLLFVVAEDCDYKYYYFPLANGASNENGKLCISMALYSVTISEVTDISAGIWCELVEHAISRMDYKALDVLLNLTYREEELCDYNDFDSKFVDKHYKLDEVEDVIRHVNMMSLPVQLQEMYCKTFGDLYRSINTLRVLNEKPTKDYEDGTDALGCYSTDGSHRNIYLYLDSIYKHYLECLPKLSDCPFLSFNDMVKVVYIHELFHAYFDTFNKDVCKEVARYVEEPLADYATLLTVKDDSRLYDLARKDIADKFGCQACRQYGLGAEDIGVDILKKYKYMKYILCSADIKDYVSCISNGTSSKQDCLCQLKSIFTESVRR